MMSCRFALWFNLHRTDLVINGSIYDNFFKPVSKDLQNFVGS